MRASLARRSSAGVCHCAGRRTAPFAVHVDRELQGWADHRQAAEWADATAMFYWFRNQTFGAPDWLRPVTDALIGSPATLALLTWSAVGIEFAVALAILLGPPGKRVFLATAVLPLGGAEAPSVGAPASLIAVRTRPGRCRR
jgi:hypothetical protein